MRKIKGNYSVFSGIFFPAKKLGFWEIFSGAEFRGENTVDFSCCLWYDCFIGKTTDKNVTVEEDKMSVCFDVNR